MLKNTYMRLLLLILTFFNLQTNAQSGSEEVIEPINALFDGMRQSDTTLIRSAFAPTALLQTITKTKDGLTSVRTEELNKFISSIAKPHEAVYDERITVDMVKVDGDLASVWTPYRFYIGDKFSHCGVNSFQLVRIDGAWKIQYIIDTRRREGCE